MDKRPSWLPLDYEWSDALPGPANRTRIVRTPAPKAPATTLQRVSIVFESPLPVPSVTELDANTGWAEFQRASPLGRRPKESQVKANSLLTSGPVLGVFLVPVVIIGILAYPFVSD
jgi:hypothetical protein